MNDTQLFEMVERVWNRPPPRPADSKNALSFAIKQLVALGHKPEAIEDAAMRSDYWTVKAIGWNMSAVSSRPHPRPYVAAVDQKPRCTPEQQSAGLAAARAALNPKGTK